MSFADFPQKYLDFNTLATKNLNVVVEIEGSPYMFSLVDTFTKIRYGDGTIYGDGSVYGGLRKISNVLGYLSTNSSLTIGQKIEPEQGRASAATMSLEFIDKDGFMTKFVSPGQTLDEILGGKLIKVWVGYQQTSFKEDYFVVFRGYITGTTAAPSKMILQITDPNIKRKAQVFFTGKTQLAGSFKSFNPADVNTLTQFITIAAHDFGDNDEVYFTSTGALPTGLAASTLYYVGNKTTNTFQLYNKPESDNTRAIVNYANGGSGVHTITLNRYGTHRTNFNLIKSEGFLNAVLSPGGTYDSSLSLFLKIDNEYMNYTSVVGTSITVTRGNRSTTAEFHAIGADIDNQFELSGNLVDLALKVQLSGKGAPWKSAIAIQAFNETSDAAFGNVPKCIVLPDKINAVEDYGLASGDYIYVTGSAFNNATFTVDSFATSNGYPNKLIFVNETTVTEAATTGLMALRSQYDTLPKACACSLKPIDLDVAGWQKIRTLFAFQPDCNFRFLIQQAESGKDWIEQQLLLPTGLYSTTRFGRISVSATKPPLASDLLVVLDNTNVIEPQSITVSRALNTRRFFNSIQFKYDYGDDDKEKNVLELIDTTSLTVFDTDSTLPISSKGLRSDLSADSFINRRGGYILRRYKGAAYEISLRVNFQAASLIQVSDTILLNDNGGLQITNFQTGLRDIGSQLFEVIDVQLDLKSGVGNVKLLSNLGYQVDDRFGGISPSSQIKASESTTTRIKLKPSFGSRYQTQEYRKWDAIIGDYVKIHSPNYSFSETVQIFSFDTADKNVMIVTPPLSVAPSEDYIVDLASFDISSVNANSKSKLLFTYIDPTLLVISGISGTQFTVTSGDAALMSSGYPIKIHNTDYTINSAESIVDTIVGTTVTLKTDLGFTPAAGQFVELVGFKDPSGAYRIL